MSYDFSVDGYDDPGPDVLDNGLPDLPDDLEPLHGVAVARWVDCDFGVVLVVYRNAPGDVSDDEIEYENDVQTYIRVDGVWEPTSGSGGSDWFSPPFERPPTLGRFDVSGGHKHQQSGGGEPPILVVDGIAGEGISTIEVNANGRVVVMPIESPMGAWVVGISGTRSATWTARDADGRVAATGQLEESDFGMPKWVHQRMRQVGTSQGYEESDANGGYMSVSVQNDQMPDDLRAWFERASNRGRDPNEKYIESDRVPEWQRIADDLRSTAQLELEIHAYPEIDDPETVRYDVSIDGERVYGFSSGFDESDREAFLADFADHLCECVLHEEVWGGWPTCPVHNTHPLDTVLDENRVACWRCPKGAVSVRIGELASIY